MTSPRCALILVAIALLAKTAVAGTGHRSFQLSDIDTSKMDPRDAALVIRAVREILWSANPDPKAAADEDYALIERYCQNHRCVNPGKSGQLDVNLIALAAFYYKGDESASSAYLWEIDARYRSGQNGKRQADPNFDISPDE